MVLLGGSGVGIDLKGACMSVDHVCTPACRTVGTLSIQNKGNLDAKSSTVKIYLSPDGVTYDEGNLLKRFSTGNLRAGGEKIKKVVCNLPAGISGSGKYLVAVIDAENTVAEVDETNNRMVWGPIP